MKTFKDLKFKDHPAIAGKDKEKIIEISPMFKGALQAKIEFDNGKSLSVIFGEMFYSNGVDTYEAMELGLSNNEPRGYLSEDEVTEYMKELQLR